MSDTRDSELRGNVPRAFLERLDAVAMADDISRMELVMSIVGPELERRIHRATVLLRVVGINPLASDRGADERAAATLGNEQTRAPRNDRG